MRPPRPSAGLGVGEPGSRRATPLHVLEPGRRRRREVDVVVAFVLALAGVGLLTLAAGVAALVVLIVRGLG